MKADKIRNGVNAILPQKMDQTEIVVFYLAEIAAQLAEANELTRETHRREDAQFSEA